MKGRCGCHRDYSGPEKCPHCRLRPRGDELDALRCMVAVFDASLMEQDHDLDDLIDRKLIAASCSAGLYRTVLTPNGRALIREVVGRGPHTSGNGGEPERSISDALREQRGEVVALADDRDALLGFARSFANWRTSADLNRLGREARLLIDTIDRERV